MGLKVATPPTDEPVSLAEAQVHLRTESGVEESLIEALIQAAREQAEAHTCRTLMRTTYTYTLDRFSDEIWLPKPPMSSVTTVAYVDVDGDDQTLTVDVDYTVDDKQLRGRIVPVFGGSWPSTREVINAVTITYVGGYADAATVPAGVKSAMLLMIDHWYNHRASVNFGSTMEMPQGAVAFPASAAVRAPYWPDAAQGPDALR